MGIQNSPPSPDSSSTASAAQARNYFDTNPPSGFASSQATATWQALTETTAAEYCRQEGYPRVVSSISGAEYWEYSHNHNQMVNSHQYYARLARTWSATCEKKVRVRRR